MYTAAVEKTGLQQYEVAYWAVTPQPIEPVHDYTIPIIPFQRPPTKDDFRQIKRRRKQQDSDHDRPRSNTDRKGHVDDYA